MRVLMIGAGLAGLVAARDLASAGQDVEVWEAADQPGGNIRAADLGGVSVDVGAEAFMASAAPVTALLEEMGLATEAPPAGGSHVWSTAHDRPVAIPTRSMLGMPAELGSPEVRKAIGTLGGLRARLDSLLPARVGADAGDPVTLARTRMGRRVADRLVAPIAGAIHGADARTLDLDRVAPKLRAALAEHGTLAAAVASLRDGSSPVMSVAGGMNLLISALAEGLTVTCGRPAVSLERDDDAWIARSEDGAEWRGDRVVLAADARTLHTLLAPLDAEFAATDPTVREGATVRLVTLLLDAPELDSAPIGTGMLAGADSGLRAKAITHLNHKWPTVGARLREARGAGVHAVRVSYGRRGEALPDVTEAEAVADAARMTGVPLRADQMITSEVTTWTMTASSQAATEFGRAAEAAAARVGVDVTGAAVAGTGLAAVVPHARRVAAGEPA